MFLNLTRRAWSYPRVRLFDPRGRKILSDQKFSWHWDIVTNNIQTFVLMLLCDTMIYARVFTVTTEQWLERSSLDVRGCNVIWCSYMLSVVSAGWVPVLCISSSIVWQNDGNGWGENFVAVRWGVIGVFLRAVALRRPKNRKKNTNIYCSSGDRQYLPTAAPLADFWLFQGRFILPEVQSSRSDLCFQWWEYYIVDRSTGM